MLCAWESLLAILPHRYRDEVDRLGKDALQEIRLRVGRPVILHLRGKTILMERSATTQDIEFVVNAASKYSPWSAGTSQMGYLTAPGGHRVGLCGECVIKDGQMTGFRSVESVCIRVARDVHRLAPPVCPKESSLILGPPGSGKTTLLRDMVRSLAAEADRKVAVVDERRELFPAAAGFDMGLSTDVLSGCSKGHGILLTLRTMNPSWIAVDEITEDGDTRALLQAVRCGVKLLATAHAESVEDLYRREVYKPLIHSGIFCTFYILRRDQTWYMERTGT